MAAGVIKNMSDFRLVPTFQLPFLNLSAQDMDFQETSEEEEDIEDESGERDINKCPESEHWGPRSHPFTTVTSSTEMTLQLLNFTELINSDIQKYFGRKAKEDDPDACNIYEDRFSAGKSGRELYYADLIRIAQNGDLEEDDSHVPLTPPREIDTQTLKLLCDRESIQKLGPLGELFEYGLRKYMKQAILSRRRDGKRQKLDRKYANIIPMHKRRLPSSFWREPISPTTSVCILHTSTPDFSDLLANWTSESNGQDLQVTREIASEMNGQSLELESYQVI